MKKETRLGLTLLMVGVACLFVGRMPNAEGVRPIGGSLSGRVYGYSMYDEVMPLVWARVSAYWNGTLVESVSTGFNGTYVIFLPAGLVNVTVTHPGFKTQSLIVAISDGGAAQLNFFLERSEIPIPEFEAYLLPIMVASLLVFVTAITRRKRHLKIS